MCGQSRSVGDRITGTRAVQPGRLAVGAQTDDTDVMRLGATALFVAVLVACGSESATETDATVVCEPVGRFRVDGIDYEVQTYDDVVAPDDVGDMYAENLTRPSEVEECVPFLQLRDGETDLSPGTDVYVIDGVDPTEALAAAPGAERYVRFVAQP